MRFFRLGLILFVVLAAAFAVGISLFEFCSGGEEIRNVLLVSIDTCRPDHLSCYGYSRQTTPNIDTLAEGAFVFRNAVSPVPITLPAHSSMLTGAIPPAHGVRNNLGYKLGESNLTLAEILQEDGFSTAAIVGGFVLDSQFGLDQGFDTYNDDFGEGFAGAIGNERRGAEVSTSAIEWIDRHHAEKFFLFLHYYDPHVDYKPPEPFASEFADNPYAGEIAYVDNCIGRVIDHLKKLKLYDSTLIIITADHGEMLGEHGEKTHKYFIYQSALKVPLIFKLAGSHKGRSIDDLAGIIDIPATICSLLGIEIENRMGGMDLSRAFDQDKPAVSERNLYCESVTAAVTFNANILLGIVTDRFKYIQTTRPELYDIVEDPCETVNLIESQPHRARILQDHLKQMLKQATQDGIVQSEKNNDWRDLRRLQSLGYIAGVGNTDIQFDQSKADPKDLFEHYDSYLRFLNLLSRQDRAGALSLCKELIAREPQLVETNLFMAVDAMKQGDYARAVPALENLVALDHDLFKTHYNLGVALAGLGKFDRAVDHYRRAIEIKPQAHRTHAELADALIQLKQVDKAIGHYEKSLAIEADQAIVLGKLAAAYSGNQQTEQAVSCWRRAIQLKPDWPSALNNLAWIRATDEDPRFRDPSRAVELALRASELTGGKNLSVLDTLAVACSAAGDFQQAVKTAEKALEIARSTNRKDLIEKARKRLELFASGSPYDPQKDQKVQKGRQRQD